MIRSLTLAFRSLVGMIALPRRTASLVSASTLLRRSTS